MNRRPVLWAILLAGVLVYPLAVLAGGLPRFPSTAECVRPATQGGNIEAVFGRFHSHRGADTRLRYVLQVGFKGTVVEQDGCGLLKVVVHGVPTLEVGRDLITEARAVGLHPTLEASSP